MCQSQRMFFPFLTVFDGKIRWFRPLDASTLEDYVHGKELSEAPYIRNWSTQVFEGTTELLTVGTMHKVKLGCTLTDCINSRTEVVAKRDAALVTVKAGTYVKPTRQTVGEWLDTWLETYVAPSVRPKTSEGYEYIIRVHLNPTLGQIELRGLHTHQIQQVLNKKHASGLSARTVELILVTLKSALKQALQEGLITRNAAEFAKKPQRKAKKVLRVLSLPEMQALTAAREHRKRA